MLLVQSNLQKQIAPVAIHLIIFEGRANILFIIKLKILVSLNGHLGTLRLCLFWL